MEMIEALTSPLILTKLRAPTVRQRSISRAHLLDRLTPDSGVNLVLVCAPAGYGKTTLLAEWAQSLRQRGAALAWYSLDASDDDPVHFGAYLVASLTQALGAAPELEGAAQLLRSSPEIDLLRILPVLINAVAASEQECRLILDDYHLISAPAIHSALAFLLEHLPENMRIFLGSRSDPPLSLARLRARGQLLEIRAADLRFTQAETEQFLNNIMHLGLPEGMVAALEARTEGWAAGLLLAALALANHPKKERFIESFTGSYRHLMEYLLDEVFNRQPAQVQAFLLATSALERMCAPLCDALLDAVTLESSSQGKVILEQLEQSNLFIVALDDKDRWYRYHHLFRDFLQSRLERDHPEWTIPLHRAASEWLAANDFLHEAAQHAFEHARQTQDWEYAAAFVEQYNFWMIIHSEIATLHEWCSTFPEAVMLKHPLLCILQCWSLVFRFQRQHSARVEERLRQAEEVIAGLEDKQAARDLRDHAAVVRTFLSMVPDQAADAREHLALAQETLRYYQEEDASQFSTLLTIGYCHMALQDAGAARQILEKAHQIALHERLYFGVVESTFHLARLAHASGKLRAAEALCRQGKADIAAMLAHPEQELRALGCLDIVLGSLHLEQDRLEEADHDLQRGIEWMGWGMNPYYSMAADIALFRLREVHGRSTEALAHLAHMEAAWPDIAFCAQALRAAHSLRGNPYALQGQAGQWSTFLPALDGNARLPGMGPFGGAEAYHLAYLAWARILTAAGKPGAALACIEPQVRAATAQGITNRVIELSVLEAQAAQATGDAARAEAALDRALAAGEAEGYLRSFDQGPVVAALLARTAEGSGQYREYARRILRAIEPSQDCSYESAASTARTGAAPGNSDRLYECDRLYEGDRLYQGDHLSEREIEVLQLMANGASNRAIAARLVITVGTVKSHINHILGKLGAHNRTEAVARARSLGLLEI